MTLLVFWDGRPTGDGRGGTADVVADVKRREGSVIHIPTLVSAAIYYYNWQSAFVITGALGLAWVVLWLLVYRTPARHPWLSER